MKPIKIAQIGAEHDHASDIMRNLRKKNDIFEVVGYAIPNGEINQYPPAYEGLPLMSVDELLSIPDLDAVAVETSELNLTKYAAAAVERGLAVHMDKPGGTEPADFEALITAAKNRRVVFHTGYMYRYNPVISQLIQDIRDGKLGDIYCVEAQMNCMHKPQKRQWLERFPGGMMFYLGCHLIDLVLQIQGMPKEILPLNCSTGIDGATAEDFGMAALKYENGVSFVKTCAVEAGGYMRRQLVVCGSKGTVQLLPIEGYTDSGNLYTVVRQVSSDIFNWSYDGERYRTEPFNRYDTMMHCFAEYVTGKKENPYTYDYELELYKTVIKCCRKSNGGE